MTLTESCTQTRIISYTSAKMRQFISIITEICCNRWEIINFAGWSSSLLLWKERTLEDDLRTLANSFFGFVTGCVFIQTR